MADSAGVCNSLCRWGIDCKQRWLEAILETQCNFNIASETSTQKGLFFWIIWTFECFFFVVVVVLDHFFPCGVTGAVLEPIPAAYGRRQGMPRDKLPAHNMSLFELLGVWYLAHGCLSSALEVSFCPQPGLNPRTKILFPLSFILNFTTYSYSFIIFLWLSICPFGICNSFTIGIPLSHQPYATSPSVPLPSPINTATEVTQALRNSWHAN